MSRAYFEGLAVGGCISESRLKVKPKYPGCALEFLNVSTAYQLPIPRQDFSNEEYTPTSISDRNLHNLINHVIRCFQEEGIDVAWQSL